MKKTKNIFARLLIAMVLMTMGLSAVVLADPLQGRGRGKGKKAKKFVRDRDYYDDCNECRDERGRRDRSDKKEEKFINGHDARDGRWDGRGPKTRSRRLPPPRRYFR